LASATACGAQVLSLQGPDGSKAELTAADIAALPHIQVQSHGRDASAYLGVPLGALLAKVGVPQGEALRGPAMRLIVVAKGSDGYGAVLALAETDPAFRTDQMIVADRRADGPLKADEGPFRLVVGGDLRPARSVRSLSRIEVRRVEP
jgi:hypothetical protein